MQMSMLTLHVNINQVTMYKGLSYYLVIDEAYLAYSAYSLTQDTVLSLWGFSCPFSRDIADRKKLHTGHQIFFIHAFIHSILLCTYSVVWIELSKITAKSLLFLSCEYFHKSVLGLTGETFGRDMKITLSSSP